MAEYVRAMFWGDSREHIWTEDGEGTAIRMLAKQCLFLLIWGF